MSQCSTRMPIPALNPEERARPLIDHGGVPSRARQASEEVPESLPGSPTNDGEQATISDPLPLFNLDPNVIKLSGMYVVIMASPPVISPRYRGISPHQEVVYRKRCG